MEAKRSQSISNCVHLYEALPTTKSVPILLHTVSSFLPGISSGNSACSHRLSGKVCSESCMCLFVCDLRPASSSVQPSLSVSFCVCGDIIWNREGLKIVLCLLTEYVKLLRATILHQHYVHVLLCLHYSCVYVRSSPILSSKSLKITLYLATLTFEGGLLLFFWPCGST